MHDDRESLFCFHWLHKSAVTDQFSGLCSDVTFIAAGDNATVTTPNIMAGNVCHFLSPVLIWIHCIVCTLAAAANKAAMQSVVHIIDAVLIPDLAALPPSPGARYYPVHQLLV